MQNKITKKLIIFFFYGIAFQFIAHTIVVYGIGISDSGLLGIIWIRKEILIIILGADSLLKLYKANKIKILYKNKIIFYTLFLFSTGLIISLLNSIFIHNQTIITFLLSIKFTYFPLFIGIVGILISLHLNEAEKRNIITGIVKNIKVILIFSMIWYFLLHTIPNGLDRIGYSQPLMSIERTANTPPPSLWLTEFYTGYVRNQGPFGGPLSLGFYFATLWPVFFSKVLYRKKISHVRGRWLLYIVIIISSFSRAARGAFFISNIALGFILLKQYRKYIITIVLGTIIGIGLYISAGGTSEILMRTWSDKGHKEYITQGLKMIEENRLWGLGATSVGPSSYHNIKQEVFNPENQYMQIRLEYGLLGLISRVLAYISISYRSLCIYRKALRKKIRIESSILLKLSMIVSMMGLIIANLVLHPMTDSSVMYPFMMLSGLLFSISTHDKTI